MNIQTSGSYNHYVAYQLEQRKTEKTFCNNQNISNDINFKANFNFNKKNAQPIVTDYVISNEFEKAFISRVTNAIRNIKKAVEELPKESTKNTNIYVEVEKPELIKNSFKVSVKYSDPRFKNGEKIIQDSITFPPNRLLDNKTEVEPYECTAFEYFSGSEIRKNLTRLETMPESIKIIPQKLETLIIKQQEKDQNAKKIEEYAEKAFSDL